MEGWIKVHRGILENPIWIDRPFSKGQAWIDIILLANHKGKRRTGWKPNAAYKPRQFLTSELKLMDRWGWSKKEGKRVSGTSCVGQHDREKWNRQGTVINVVNYGKYQDLGTENEPIGDREGTERRPRRHTTKKERMIRMIRMIRMV